MEGYLSPETRAKRIKGALAVIKFREKHHGDTFDAIAYRGASGAITASIIAYELKKPLILVRKPEDTKGHSPYMVEGPTRVKRYLIIDDFMSTGKTYEAIREAVRAEHPHAECLGMLEVTYCEGSEASEGRDRRYRFSNEHRDEIERNVRISAGKATRMDVEWITRENPISPNVVYRTVGIIKEGDKFKFDFENNRQKLLVDDTTPKLEFKDMFKELIDVLKMSWTPTPLKTEKPTETVATNEPEVDGVDIYRFTNPFSNFFYNPMKYRTRLAASEPRDTNDPVGLYTTYEQKTQASPEAVATAGAKG